jgi:acetolactate synthase small subunit
MSRMVLVVEACDVRQVIQQLARLVDVLSVEEVDAEPSRVDTVVEAVLRFDMPHETTHAQLIPEETAR